MPAPLLSRQKLLIRIHFYLLLFILINAFFRWTLHIGFNPGIMLISKILFFFSGASSFLITVKPFRIISLYFSIYILTPLITCLSFVFGGLAGAVVLSVLILPFYEPITPTLKNGSYVIHPKYEGFLGAAGNYIVYKNECLILQKRIGEVRIDWDMLTSDATFSIQDKTMYLNLKKVDINTRYTNTDSFLVNNVMTYKTKAEKPDTAITYRNDTIELKN